MDLLCRPFTWATHLPYSRCRITDSFSRINPCGHVACLNCLQQWFRSSPTGANNNPIYSRKTCPCCRTTITTRPIESFTIKNAAHVLATIPEFAPPSSQDSLEPTPEDPWEGIFVVARRSSDGIRDEEDGGIIRCNTCLYEIHGGVCAGCGREYDIDDEAGFYGADDVGELFADAWSGNEDEDDEAYEGSFINDDDADNGFAGGFIDRILGFANGRWNGSDHGQEQEPAEEQAFYSDDGHASWEDDPLPARGRRQSQAIIISDSEDDDEDDEADAPIRPGLLSRLRGPRTINLLSDSDGDDEAAAAPGPRYDLYPMYHDCIAANFNMKRQAEATYRSKRISCLIRLSELVH